MLDLEEREVEQLYTWKKRFISDIDKIVEMVKQQAPKAYENEEFQRSIKELKDSVKAYCIEKQKVITDLTNCTQKE